MNKRVKTGFLIDMDGVIYRGSELIPGADRFIGTLQREAIPFLFLTNNSQRTRRDVVTKLRRMGIDVDDSHVFTCAIATARGVPPESWAPKKECMIHSGRLPDVKTETETEAASTTTA